MAFVFDYELLKESYEINLETVERAENEITEDDVEEAKAEFPEQGYTQKGNLFDA